jgi:methionyl aminopeptidase
MSIRSRHDLERLRAVGTVVALALKAMKAVVSPSVSTGELDAVAAGVFEAAARDPHRSSATGFPAPSASASTPKPSTAFPGPIAG